MERIIHDLVQGSDEWHQFRFEHDGASESAAALGTSKKTTRTELLRMKHTGIAKEFSDWVRENVLDRGHEVEAAARPFVEQMIGQELYPATYSYGRLSASCDGLTMDGETAFEHKQYNRELFAAVKRAELPDEYMPQCQQVMHVTGATRLIFVCSDGTPENMASMEVQPDPAWVKRIEAGWAQFHEDLENYQHVEAAPVAVAAAVMELPTLFIQAKGEITATNMPQFREQLTEYIGGLNMTPTTDQEFADSKAIAKNLRECVVKIKERKADMLAQTMTMGEIAKEIDFLADMTGKAALALEKAVTAEEENRKLRLIDRGRKELAAHISSLNKRLVKVQMPPVVADFAAAIKSKRNLDSMENGINTEVARAKMAASEIADRIDENLKALALEQEHTFLFNDFATLVMKAPDDLALIIRTRIADHKREEERRAELAREKIRAEEEARAAAKVKAEQEEAERQRKSGEEAAAKIERDRMAAPTTVLSEKSVADASAKAFVDSIVATEPAAQSPATAAAYDNGRYIRLGEINQLLGFTVTAEFLSSLGFEATTDRQAKLYRECDMPAICQAIIEHVAGVPARMQTGKLKAAA